MLSLRRAAAALALVSAAPAVAQTLPEGCFARDYDAAHLAANPDQNVAALRLSFHPQHRYGENVVEVHVRLSDQARARAEGVGGREFTQFAYCWDEDTGPICAVECDAGRMEILAQDGDSLTVRTGHFWVGEVEGCGGAFDLAEDDPVRHATTYRLTRAPAAACPPLLD